MKSNSRHKSARASKGSGNPSFRTSAVFRANRVYKNTRDFPKVRLPANSD